MTATPLDLAPQPKSGQNLMLPARAFVSRWKGPRTDLAPVPTVAYGLVAAWIVAMVAVALLLDVEISRYADTLPPIFRVIFEKVTRIGTSGYVFAATVLGCLAALVVYVRRRGLDRARAGLVAARAFYLFAVCAVSGLASVIIKQPIGRPRPFLIDTYGPFGFHPFVFNAKFASFPSGHTITAFAMAVAIGFLAPRLRTPLLIVAVLVAISRLVLGSHYLSDTMGGALIGILSAVILRRLFARRRIVFEADGGRIVPRLLPRRRQATTTPSAAG
ncbi:MULTISPECIES: phosphatase PAP2 family protein [unclassified Beijerinckia]|uniref:phosphatase PAP2 family protein n=1 Tax=unclassified Beijerinckia TaxID=2638183 RepID=UPI00089C4D94|nr:MULTISPECIES: phosphatase PAP2 family protein [unclassified Beijerinckia]MDH7795242.1 membrane-associated phospholipid phosphatase [Beijerinckia sp. GAS462]SEB93375.1 undecaprenyl-diphosphatase [Beijerinckia sp. 28-YEA-48]